MNARAKSVLAVHNYYQQSGGEDRAFENETALMSERGHKVIRHTDHNRRIGRAGLGAAFDAVWSGRSFQFMEEFIRSESVDVAHFHNTFPLISPSAYFPFRRAGIPVVQTLHNFRLVCPGATLSRDGAVCEECLHDRTLFPALTHGCYRASRPATAAVATMLTVHRAAGTWQRKVDAYIALSEFARRKLIAGGLPAERIVVKPNFLPRDPGAGGGGSYALFVGRLAEEKGIRTLAAAWRSLGDIPLLVAGEGPLREMAWPEGVTRLGGQSHDRVLALMRGAHVLVFPSNWYECSPLTIVEALASGLPVIGSDLGSITEFVKDHQTGLLFRPGDPTDLAAKVRWAFDHPQELAAMRVAARQEFEEKYTAERNYKMLMEIYDLAIENARRRRSAA